MVLISLNIGQVTDLGGLAEFWWRYTILFVAAFLSGHTSSILVAKSPSLLPPNTFWNCIWRWFLGSKHLRKETIWITTAFKIEIKGVLQVYLQQLLVMVFDELPTKSAARPPVVSCGCLHDVGTPNVQWLGTSLSTLRPLLENIHFFRYFWTTTCLSTDLHLVAQTIPLLYVFAMRGSTTNNVAPSWWCKWRYGDDIWWYGVK